MNEELLKELLSTMKAIASTNPPNWRRPLSSYKNFNWEQIGAKTIRTDDDGVSDVLWCGHIYTRRSGSNAKFGAAIWFSRATGKGDDDEAQYLKLITFKNTAPAEPLPDYVAKAIR